MKCLFIGMMPTISTCFYQNCKKIENEGNASCFFAQVRQTIFSVPPDLNERFSLRQPVTHDEGSFSIESIHTLKHLLLEKSLCNEPPVIRFLVDTAGIAWFARETYPDIIAPKHFQMTGAPQNNAHCSTAGNMRFANSKCSVLKTLIIEAVIFIPRSTLSDFL